MRIKIKTGHRIYLRFLEPVVLPFISIYKKHRVKGKMKVFCIGFNKTGTTSLYFALKELGFEMGVQRRAELLFDDWLNGNFERIKKYCESAQAFQDVPFSYPETYKHMDKAFPDSKFILTIRDDAEQWYQSVIKFYSKSFADGIRKPTKEDLQNAVYHEKGRPWKSNQALFNTPENDPYNKEILIKYYNERIAEIKEYFKSRQDDLLIINVSKNDSYHQMCNFLGVQPLRDSFPWKNQT